MADQLWDMLSLDYGTLAVVVRKGQLIRICFESSPVAAIVSIKRFHPEAEQSSQPLTREVLKQLTEYFNGQRHNFDVPLANDSMTPFTCAIQQELIKVPYGSVISYGDLAALAGFPKAARAVGGVMSSNPFPLIVPCHRVVNADGRIGHYSAANGSKTKSWLIKFERDNSR